MLRYGGESNVPGAPGNLQLGNYFIPAQYPKTPNVLSGPVPMGNAGFFAGPQYGQQIPAGFQNKTIY